MRNKRIESADEIQVFDSVLLGNRVTLRAELHRQLDEIELRISTSQAQVDDAYQHAIPQAVRWLLDLDAGAVDRILGGGSISRIIPLSPPVRLPAMPPSANADQYMAVRATAAWLIRPLLVPRYRGPLMPYQEQGVQWLKSHRRGILADDMGLGKTAQAISACSDLVGSGDARTILVVCPSSLVSNWEDEWSRWAPDLIRLRVIGGGNGATWSAVTGRVHVVMTTYDSVRLGLPAAIKGSFDVVIADEAHHLRNADSKTSRGLRGLDSQYLWALTGTPIERDTRDLATLLSLLMPSRFSPEDADLSDSALRARAKPFLLRRNKVDVLEQLPATLERLEVLELADSQRTAYRDTVRKITTNPVLSQLSTINRLRLLCDYEPETGASAKVERISELIQLVQLQGEKAVVFSHLIKPLELLAKALSDQKIRYGFIVGAMNRDERAAAVADFQKKSEISVVLCSSKVAGEGLTLTAANHVFFLNEWWNPSANQQARDRVVRIGQQRGVFVYHFRMRDTIEEVLDRILERKEATVDSVINALRVPGSPDVGWLLKEVRKSAYR